MDTRSKIVTVEEIPECVTIVTGYFEVLRAELVRKLQEVRDRTIGRSVVAVVLQHPAERLQARARAEIVAALRFVDYVLIVSIDAFSGILATFPCAEFVRLEGADLRWTRDFFEEIRHRHAR
jgi:hypothetical protein